MQELLGYLITGGVALIVGILSVLVLVWLFKKRRGEKLFGVRRSATPETAKDEYYLIKKEIDDTEILINADGSNHKRKPKLEDRIKSHKKQGDYLWGSNRLIDRYRSAYFYALAAYSCYKEGKYGDAGLYYHFAAHGFWRLGEYNKSTMCYKWSGDSYVEASMYPNARRAYLRAIQVSHDAGYHDIEKDLVKLEQGISEFVKVSKSGLWNEKGEFRDFIPH